jgi:cell shape-determining protein MreC
MDKVTGEVARAANNLGNQLDSVTASSQEIQELKAELEKLKVELAGKDQLIALYDQQLTLANRLQIETSQVQEARRKGFWRK